MGETRQPGHRFHLTDSFPEWHGVVLWPIVSELQSLRNTFVIRSQFGADFWGVLRKGMLLESTDAIVVLESPLRKSPDFSGLVTFGRYLAKGLLLWSVLEK